MREKEDKSVATITIPFFKAPQCLLDLTSEEKSYENLSHQVIGTSWQVIKKHSVAIIFYNVETFSLSAHCLFSILTKALNRLLGWI